jgi:hypothetical protein
MPADEWLSISPFLAKRVQARHGIDGPLNEWDFISFEATEEELRNIQRFYELTKGDRYDWVGLVLSQILPYHIKRRGKWYCSEWIAYALRISGILKWDRIRIYDQSDLSPQKLYEMVTKLD